MRTPRELDVESRPTGTVAFLFTDVEASTRRWECYGEAMRDAVRRHDEILRSEIAARRGYIFKTIGDAFCAAFWTIDEALEAAVETQRRIAREDFSSVDGLHVRMAIHAGETDERDGDYFGTALNRTSRLLSAGHGGQILISGDAADLALASLPPGINLRHLGSLPLKDIRQPERVYQPAAEGLRSEFKPLRALETPPNNLPRRITSFVGRHEDLARVEALLDEGPLVTLVGAGGIGKTRLALEVAAARLNDERDGAWFVDLSSIGDAGLIAGTILSTLGGEPSPGGDPLDDLLAHLEKRDLLLVLDNSEHIVSEVATIVAKIIARCTQVTVLATSRSPLDISGERIYRLATLDQASAVQLFADRARAANPAFRLETKAAVVDEICARLDGIALAIELAAARVRAMSVEDVASHLELRLLAGGRDRRPRQQTMRTLIDWSYDLLTDEERVVLRRAAVFMRGFTLGLATAVCRAEGDDEWRILELLTSLVDKSLVVAEAQEGDQRYRLLEPIREYCWEKLEAAAESRKTQSLHAAAIALLAEAWYEEWDGGPEADWLVRVDRDLANLRAALRWSVEEANDLAVGARLAANATIVFLRLALLVEGVERCDKILQRRVRLHGTVEARLRYGLSMLYSNLGQSKSCLEEALIAASLFRAAGDARGLARALSQVASRYAFESRYDDAKAPAQEALELARNTGDRRLLADVLRRCAGCFATDGPDRTRSVFAESVALFQALGRNDDTGRALTWWGQWEAEAGNYSEAVERFTAAARLDSKDSAAMFNWVEIAGCYLALDDLARAEPFARKGLAVAVKARYAVGTAIAILHFAVLAANRDPHAAARLLGYAQARLHEEGYEPTPPEPALIERLMADLEGRFDKAELERLLEEGTALSEDRALSHAFSH